MNNRLHSIVLLILVIVVSYNGYVFYLGSQEKETKESAFIKVYGPGEEPHIHQIAPERHSKISDVSKSPTDLPPPLNREIPQNIAINLEANEVIAEVAPGVETLLFTYNGTIPGPFLRVRVGDRVTLTLNNPEKNTHIASIDLHAVTGPGGGGKVQVPPGEKKDFTFTPQTPGLFIYHGASGNVGSIMSKGMYGMILVEPEKGLEEVDHEFYVMQGEYYLEGLMGEEGIRDFSPERYIKEDPTYIVFNGRVRSLVDNIMQANVGDKIRIYFGNAGVSKVSSFHVIGETFDKVYREASLLSPPALGLQTTVVPAGGATITELTLDYPGKFILLDHSIIRIDKGAWGILNVLGEKDPSIFSSQWVQ